MKQNNKSILVVEDDRELRYMFSVRLISAGYTVCGAEGGLEALEEMETHSVDVVLTDCRMPKMDGFEFLSVCRARRSDTPSWSFLENKTTWRLRQPLGTLSRGFGRDSEGK